ncbi:flagellar hook assembly protein FlgD [Salinarimonas ramus]|uniref:Basal-body rod modification protein FlgD n=1 Tax=Salinarimonas ramus TaxID=690164 RepID=A0A917QC48_9HYPH|nr:flagellar hook capping FlgD N-terminal domain-containing protein [Salinarimonas ramus]GGK40055.1 flagellar hook assembly protein [Salinarimonas ramus]
MASGITTTGTSPANAGAGESATDRRAIAQNFDQFLLLLTTQLQAQNPLDPLDTNQFTQQLVQFASVEQQIKTNEMLGSLLTSTRASNVATASSFIGKRIEAGGNVATLADGQASWSLDLPRAASRAVIEILDETGQVVATRTQSLEAGEQSYVWDGRTDSGAQAPDGAYTIRVQARDTAGEPVEVSTKFSGVVDGLDLSGAEPILLVGKVRVPLSEVTGVSQT